MADLYPAPLRFEGLTLDAVARTLIDSSGRDIKLRNSEFELLVALVAAPGRALNRDSLLEAVARRRAEPYDRTIDVLIGRLRRKIEADPKQPRLILTVPGVGYRFAGKPMPIPSPGNRRGKALEPPDKPSLAVLPFANMSGDPDQEYFSDGLAEDIITDLSRSRALFVIARNSSFAYRGRALDLKQVAHELGVRYVLEGSVRRSGQRVRITAQLIDTETANHVWAQRYDRDLADIFATQDEITEAVALAIKPALADAERRRAVRKPPESLGAWDACQRGLWHLARIEVAENQKARHFFEHAIHLDPTFAPAYLGLVNTYLDEGNVHYTRSIREVAELSEPLARKAVALDPGDAGAHTALSYVATANGDLGTALASADQAVALNPNSSAAHRARGISLLYSGQTREAYQTLLTSLRLNPRQQPHTVSFLVIASYLLGDYAGAVEQARRVLRLNPNLLLMVHRWLAAALGQLGRAAEAQDVMRRASLALTPEARDEYGTRQEPWLREEDHAHLLDGLRQAGWPV